MNKIIVEDAIKIIEAPLPYELLFGKNILISGANGYVPAYFVHAFLALNDKYGAGINVIALCRNKRKSQEKFADYIQRKDFRLLIQDVCLPIEPEEKIHIFIHAASPAGIKSRHDNPINTFCANVNGVQNMLELAMKNPCEKFLFLSSVDIYGNMESEERLCEQDIGVLDHLNVRNIYSCAKRAAETLCKAYHVTYGLPVYIVRPFQIMGPDIRLNDGRLHIDFISQILRDGQIVLKSDGSAKRTFLYITDAINAMFYVLLQGVEGEVYNIVDESGEATVKELAERMASLAVKENVQVIFDYEQRNTIEVKGALPIVTGSSAKIKELGWKPEYNLEEGSARMMKFYGA